MLKEKYSATSPGSVVKTLAANDPQNPNEQSVIREYNPPNTLSSPIATVIHGLAENEDDKTKEERCITNPAWIIPVSFNASIQIFGEDIPLCPILPTSLTVEFTFPISISSHEGVFLQMLDYNGESISPVWELIEDPGWETHNDIYRSKLSLSNGSSPRDLIPCFWMWNAVEHRPEILHFSYVVYMRAPKDIHGNQLNDLAATFTIDPPFLPIFMEGDFDGNGTIDDHDIDLLAAAIRTQAYSPQFDLNDDRQLSSLDMDILVFDLLQSVYGDFNLDGCANEVDYQTWNNRKFSYGSGWAGGDSNGDFVVDASDFNIWNDNNAACG